MTDRRRRIAAAVAFSRPSVGVLGWGWILFVLFLLFYPFSIGGGASPWRDVLPYGIHAGMWAGLVWSLWPLAGGRREKQRWLFALLVLAGGISEAIQGCVGRTPEWIDWGMDALGALMAFFCGRGCRKMGLGLAIAFAAVLVASIGFPAMAEWRAFPVLADGTSRWSHYRWERNGVKLRFPAGQIRAVCDRDAPTDYPGMFRNPLCRDWSGSQGMELEIYWPRRNGVGGIMGIRIDDLPGNPPYDDRWQADVAVTNGWNTLVLTNSWLRTPGGRRMDGDIQSWGVFVISGPKTKWFGLRNVQLIYAPDRRGETEGTRGQPLALRDDPLRWQSNGNGDSTRE